MDVDGSDPVRAAIVDTCEYYKAGLASELSRFGLSVDDPAGEWVAWMAQPGRRALLITDRCRDNLALIDRANAYASDVPIVALLESSSVAAVLSVLRRGARGIARIDDGADVIADSISRGMEGKLVLDTAHAQALANHSAVLPPVYHFTRDEVSILRLLGEGASTTAIAESLNVSERTVYRKQRRAFRILGVESRAEARRRAKALLK